MSEEKTVKKSSKDVEENKGMAVLSYVWLLFLIPLLGKKDSPYAQFHARQGMALFVIWLIAQLLWVVFWIPVIGQLLMIAVYVFMIYLFIKGIMNALNGKTEELPYVGSWFKGLKF